MEVVPRTWLLNDGRTIKCVWPNKISTRNEFDRLVQNKTEVSAKDCILCTVLIKFKTDSYTKAIEKMKSLVENGSSASSVSDLDGELMGKRKIQRNKIFNDFAMSSLDTESSNDDLPEVPAIQFHDLINQNHTINKSVELDATIIDDSITLSQILEVCNTTLAMVKNIFTKVGIMQKEIQMLAHCIDRQKDNTSDILDMSRIENLPAQTYEQLSEFDKLLEIPDNFAHISRIFKSFGGRDISESIRRMLQRTISHKLALETNWSGRNEKKEFKKFGNIRNLFLGALRSNSICKEATEHEVESVVKQWLRAAADRAGGRERRRRNASV